MNLRPYQSGALDAIIAAYDQGWRQQLLSMATGTGKTYIFSNLYERMKSRLPGQTLVLSHTEELVKQSLATMKDVNPSLIVDMEMAEHKANPMADVVVASVATLGRKNSSRLERFTHVDKIIVDEAHHTPADSYMNVLNAFGVLVDGTDKLLLGVTATPSRNDGKALGSIFKKISYVYSLRQAINDGYLVEVRGYRVSTQTDISGVAVHGGDFNKIELETTINTPERNKAIIASWQEKGCQRPTVAFVAGIEHAKALSEAFNEAGVVSEAIWGDDPQRAVKLAAFRAGEIKVLTNCNVLTEGVDIPSIGCVIIARPTQSSVLFTQMCGRATRLAEGKTDCIILVIEDICGGHTLCTLPSLMGLPGALDLQGRGLLETVKLIEDMQEQNPDIDFTKLKSVDGIKQFIEEVNLFQIKFPAEVENNSDFRWTLAIDGGYVMRVPRPTGDSTGTKPGVVRVRQDLLDKWVIDGTIKERVFHGERASIEEAFAVADQQIRERSPESVCLVNRKAAWMTKPATKNQMTLLCRLYGKTKVWPSDMTQGAASQWIDKKLGGKK